MTLWQYSILCNHIIFYHVSHQIFQFTVNCHTEISSVNLIVSSWDLYMLIHLNVFKFNYSNFGLDNLWLNAFKHTPISGQLLTDCGSNRLNLTCCTYLTETSLLTIWFCYCINFVFFGYNYTDLTSKLPFL